MNYEETVKEETKEKTLGKLLLSRDAFTQKYVFDSCTPEELDELWRAGIRNEPLARSIIKRSGNPDIIREASNIEGVLDIDELKYIRLSPKFPGDILVDLYRKYDIKNLLSHPNFPPELLEELSKSEDFSMQIRIAQNPSTPIKVLEKFSTNSRLHFHIIKNPKIKLRIEGAEEIIRNIYTTSDTYKLDALMNPNCPKEILIENAHSNASRRRIVAKNPSTPKDVLIKLGESKDLRILEALAQNPSCPDIVILKLVALNLPQHIKEIIKNRLKKTKNCEVK